MSKVQEIETALLQLGPQDQWEVARWLLEKLEREPWGPAGDSTPGETSAEVEGAEFGRI
jgi:hypothetical protein